MGLKKGAGCSRFPLHPLSAPKHALSCHSLPCHSLPATARPCFQLTFSSRACCPVLTLAITSPAIAVLLHPISVCMITRETEQSMSQALWIYPRDQSWGRLNFSLCCDCTGTRVATECLTEWYHCITTILPSLPPIHIASGPCPQLCPPPLYLLCMFYSSWLARMPSIA